MTLILSGTDGLSDVDGSAATPAIRGTDANTGIFFPAADTIAFSEGGVEAMRIDSSGNVGVGTASPVTQMHLYKASGTVTYTTQSGSNYGYFGNDGNYIYLATNVGATGVKFRVSMAAPDNAATIDSSGNVGIGTSSPVAKLDISGSVAGAANKALQVTPSAEAAIVSNLRTAGIYRVSNDSVLAMGYATTPDAWYISASYGSTGAYKPLAFATSDAERMRIDTSGNLLVGATVGGGFTVFYAATDCINSRSGAAAGNATSLFVGRYSATSSTSGTLCFNVTTNGNVTNANNSYGSLSDVKLKENIVDVSPKLADLMQVRIVNYNFKEGQTHKQIGVVAQELEQVFPSMIEENSDYEEVTTTDEDGNETTERVATGTTTKSVKYSVFVPMLIKALQEQQAIITQLQADVEALKAQP